MSGLAAFALIFLLLPLIGLLVRALSNAQALDIATSGIPEALTLSAITTGISAGLTLLFGTPLAYAFARWRFPFKRLLNTAIELPIVLPPAVAGLALLVTFGRRGLLGGTLNMLGITLPFTVYAVIMAQCFVAAPFFIRAAQIGFQSIAKEIEDAARVDGADGWALFRSVTLPLAFRSLSAGLILSWARALGEFGATILFAGSLQGRTQTLPLLIYNVIERDLNAAMWTGVILIGAAGIALLISHLITHRKENAGGDYAGLA